MATIAFSGIFILIANLAWATGSVVGSAWFSSAITIQVYSITLIVASILALGLAIVGSGRVGYLEDVLHELDQQIATARRGRPDGATGDEGTSGSKVDFEDILAELDRADRDTGTDPIAHDSLIEVSQERSVAAPAAMAGQSLRGLLTDRIAVRKAAAGVWPTVAGPIAVAIAFVGVAAAMLPGSEGFAATNFRLNTSLILFLAYGWPFLVAWTAIGIALASSLRLRRS